MATRAQSAVVYGAAAVQGIVLVFSTLFILTNLVVDLLYVAIDPRIRYA